MKSYVLQFALTVGLGLPISSNAQDSTDWLFNLKREVTRLAVNERAHLHSVARLSNSVMREEDLFIVSVVDLEELEIRLLPDGSVFVSKEGSGFSSDRGAVGAANAVTSKLKNCSSGVENGPRMSLVVEGREKLKQNSSANERKFLVYTHNFLDKALAKEGGFRLSSYNRGASRYDNLLRGNGFSKYKHKLLVRVQYENISRPTAFAKWNSKLLFMGPRQSHQISVELELHEGDVSIKKMKETLSLAEVGVEGALNSKGQLSPRSQAELARLEASMGVFLSDSKCLVKHSNTAVAIKGKLILDAGMDAGYTEGEQLLLMPKSGYFRKRGLLSGVEQMAIARIKKINDLKSELEVEQGAVRLESGVEFVVRPLLELI
jgi:hypothetical protein